jgi:hypothetical protein
MDVGGRFRGRFQLTSLYTFLPIRTGKWVHFLTNLTLVFTDLHRRINDTVVWYGGKLDKLRTPALWCD